MIISTFWSDDGRAKAEVLVSPTLVPTVRCFVNGSLKCKGSFFQSLDEAEDFAEDFVNKKNNKNDQHSDRQSAVLY